MDTNAQHRLNQARRTATPASYPNDRARDDVPGDPMDTPNPTDTPPKAPPAGLTRVGPRSVTSVEELERELSRALPTAWDRATAVPCVRGSEEGDPFEIDAVEISGTLRSSSLEAYVDHAEMMAAELAEHDRCLDGRRRRALESRLERLERELREARLHRDAMARDLDRLCVEVGFDRAALEAVATLDRIRAILLEPSDDQAAGGWTLPGRVRAIRRLVEG